MAYVPVPKDLTKVKSKFLFGLTKRQVICFGIGAACGLPVFFLVKGSLGTSFAAMIMIVIMLPFFLLAMYEQHGQPLEIVLKHIIEARFRRPRIRLYETDNFYAAIDRDVRLKREVNQIIHGQEEKERKEGKTQAHQGRKETAESSDGAEPSRQETAPDGAGHDSV